MKMKNFEIKKVEKLEAPCHGCYFAAGVGLVVTIITLT